MLLANCGKAGVRLLLMGMQGRGGFSNRRSAEEGGNAGMFGASGGNKGGATKQIFSSRLLLWYSFSGAGLAGLGRELLFSTGGGEDENPAIHRRFSQSDAMAFRLPPAVSRWRTKPRLRLTIAGLQLSRVLLRHEGPCFSSEIVWRFSIRYNWAAPQPVLRGWRPRSHRAITLWLSHLSVGEARGKQL